MTEIKAELPVGCSWERDMGVKYLNVLKRHAIWEAHNGKPDELLPLALALLVKAEKIELSELDLLIVKSWLNAWSKEKVTAMLTRCLQEALEMGVES